ncbi:MAG TPA: N-acetylmuramic acid 6-phosphate etherase [Candidatus Rubrimentiphilum sp.]|nr:N-acetylmuramic acid 6-phosphate etherase [Candidatus Rubrimentiphilum sp.]
MNELPQTEARNPETAGLDKLTTADLVALLASEQREAAEAVVKVKEKLAAAVDEIAQRLTSGATLHYFGAGSSGRIGFLDASEMPPTFGTDPQLVCAHIAGGKDALTRAIEGAEDDGDAGDREARGHVRANDAVVGISASGSAAFVIRAILAAREIGAWTLGVCNTAGSALEAAADLTIVLQTGAEPLTGSTRLKAGSAQKILLNTLSTATMIRLEKVYDNLMVDLVATNNKLRRRALLLVMQLVPTDENGAAKLLDAAGGRVKVAVIMGRRSITADEARTLLASHGDSLRRALS